jgi:hypothetical protein
VKKEKKSPRPPTDLWNHVLETHELGFGDYPEFEALLLEHDRTFQQLGPLENCKNGYVSPNGVFYPCGYSGHEILREYLQKIFKFEQFATHPVDQTYHFESTWVKFGTESPFGACSPGGPIVYRGAKLTARQSLFITDWTKLHWTKPGVMWLTSDGGHYRIGPNYVINNDCRVQNVQRETR